MRRTTVSVAAMVMATQVVMIPFCGSTVLPPTLTPAQRESFARAPFHNITVGVERFERPVYSERLTAALDATHLFARVDAVEAFGAPPTFVALVDRPIYGRAVLPWAPVLTLGVIPMTVDEECGYSFSLTPSSAPIQNIPIDFSYQSASTLGWWALFLNLSSDRTGTEVYGHPRLVEGLAWKIVEQGERICQFASASCGTASH
jgi:hypothetical protein